MAELLFKGYGLTPVNEKGETVVPQLTITSSASKTDAKKIASAQLTLNKAAVKLLKLVAEGSVTFGNGESVVYMLNSTDLTEEEVPSAAKRKVTKKNSLKLKQAEAEAIFASCGLKAGDNFTFTLKETPIKGASITSVFVIEKGEPVKAPAAK